MAIEILRRRVEHDVRAMLDWPEIHGTRESRVHDEGDPFLFREVTHRSEIEHATGRIHGRLEKDRTRLLPHLPPPNASLRGIQQRDIDAERRELLHEESLCTAINPRAREQMVAGAQQREQG